MRKDNHLLVHGFIKVTKLVIVDTSMLNVQIQKIPVHLKLPPIEIRQPIIIHASICAASDNRAEVNQIPVSNMVVIFLTLEKRLDLHMSLFNVSHYMSFGLITHLHLCLAAVSVYCFPSLCHGFQRQHKWMETIVRCTNSTVIASVYRKASTCIEVRLLLKMALKDR